MISSSALLQANSSHPVLSTSIEITADADTCGVYVHLVFPPLIFVDPFELANYRDSYTFEHLGSSNLELPLAALNGSGSSLLIAVAVPSGGGSVEVDVPLHFRYGTTSVGRSPGFQTAELEWPTVFLSCPSTYARHSSPPPQPPAEFEHLFDLSTSRIISIPSNQSSSTTVIQTPVGSQLDLPVVELGTVVIILLSFLYLANVIRRTASQMNPSSSIKDD
ncbi:PIG-X [Mycena crocata]|nr:PIG-X [Mycena crocata]